MKFRVPLPRLGLRGWIAAAAIAFVLVVAGAATLFGLGRKAESVMVTEAVERPFVALVVERGVLKAGETISIAAPRLVWGGGFSSRGGSFGGGGGGQQSGSAQIVEMVPEGTVVEPGDIIVRFDALSLREAIISRTNDLEQALAEKQKTLAEQDSKMASLVASLEMTQFSFEKAKLNLDKMEFEAEVRKRQEEISFKKSEMQLVRAQEAIETQKRVDASEMQRVQSRITRNQTDLDGMKRELEKTVIYAEQPGLITYEPSWGPSGQTKVKVGDTPYPGQTIITMPNLSRMTITLSVSELDIHKIAKEQEALVVVDAYPDTVYQAVVSDVSPLARRMGFSQVKVFDAVVTIRGTDLRLRPGMSAQVSIITSYESSALQIPLEAVFKRDGQALAYVLDGSFKEVPIELGPENRNFVVVTAGLQPGTRVALRDPFAPLPSIATAGAEALKERRNVSSAGGTSDIMRMLGGRGGGPGGGGAMRVFR
jgi:HlyD family secretion protein